MKFKEFLKSGPYTTVYHISPRSDIFKLRPTGHSKGQRSYIGKGQPGIFVAPKFKNAIAWAATYLGNKKAETQKPNERLKEKGRGHHGEKGTGPYKNLTIYEIRIPKEVLKKSEYFSFWEPEYFVLEEDMEKMIITKSKTYSVDELTKMYQRSLDDPTPGVARRANIYPRYEADIAKASKTNLAAKAYLELLELYNSALMGGKKPIIAEPEFTSDSDHLIRQEINKLEKYIFHRGLKVEVIERLSRQQEAEVRSTYNRIKSLIQRL